MHVSAFLLDYCKTDNGYQSDKGKYLGYYKQNTYSGCMIKSNISSSTLLNY